MLKSFSLAGVTERFAPVRCLLPGILLPAAIALASASGTRLLDGTVPVPEMVLALVLGMGFSRFAANPVFEPGLKVCVKQVLRVAVALLGIRIALSDVIALGGSNALVIIGAMIGTILSGFAFARLFGQSAAYGALAGTATAVCGASAALATATVLPRYRGRPTDVAFVVVAVNMLSTLAMVLYPPLCLALGFGDRMTGVILGATIHDVAQVVGAGYAVSVEAGDTAVVVKLFRVLLLLPVVLGIGYVFARRGAAPGEAQVPVPVFALAFIGLSILNSLMLLAPGLGTIYAPVKATMIDVSGWGFLLAVSALGLGTSFRGIVALGWRHVAVVTAATLVLLVMAIAGVAISSLEIP